MFNHNFVDVCIFAGKISATTGYCLYGDGPDCVFPCHCANKTECTTGCQPTGCATGPLDIPWQGPDCQIGNIALGKIANQTGSKWSVDGGVDGYLPGTGDGNQQDVCAHPSDEGGVAEWGVDLVDNHKLYNITIYNRYGCPRCRDRTTMFTIGIRNSSDYEELCYDDNSSTQRNYMISLTCNKPVIGRYIRFARKPEAVEYWVMNFCEFIAIGHRYFDCSLIPCEAGLPCSEVTGCERCLGSYPPDCNIACEAGFYGVNCQRTCGHCAANDTCNKTTGHCPNGCKQWWLGQGCQDYIESPENANGIISISNTQNSSLEVIWEPLEMVTSNLSQYYGYMVFYKVYNQTNYTLGSDVLNITNPQATITGLHYNTEYDIEIRPYREMNEQREYGGSYHVITHKTECGEPEKPQILNTVFIKDEDAGNYSLTIIFNSSSSIDSRCDSISHVWIEYHREAGVTYTTSPVSPDATNITITGLSEGTYIVTLSVTNNQNKSTSSEPLHVAVETTPGPTIATTVAGEINGSEGTTSTTTRAGRIEEPVDNRRDTVIIASVVAVVVVLVVVVSVAVVILLRRRKTKRKDDLACLEDLQTANRSPGEEINEAMPHDESIRQPVAASVAEVELSADNIYENAATIPRAVPLSQFVDYVKECMTRKDYLDDEYKTLPAANNARCVAAQTETNKKKNRFLNIYPYDETRVRLTDSDGFGDYINANYITGYSHSKEYIATQGPRDATVVDLWRMIWQEKSNRIVMVANLEEMGRDRCSQYWPIKLSITEQWGPFCITMETEETYADFTTRHFTVKNGRESRTVHHFHFTTWPDKSHPLYGPIALFVFHRKIHAFDRYKTGPLIVHCSAGVGRTGTFITLDILMQQAKNENQLNIYGLVEKLRKDRMLMVQTKGQYLFLHDALVDFIKYGDTAYDCNSFERIFTDLSEPQSDKQGRSKLQQQFMMIQDIKSSVNGGLRERNGLIEENKNKNRNLDIIPDDNNRPYLYGTENYINAVYVDTFKAHDAIIVTQMPLPNTISDFWRLVCDQKSHTIIMLNNMDQADQTCQPYWPEEKGGSLKFGDITVQQLSENPDSSIPSVQMRDLLVTEHHGMKKDGSPDETLIRLRHFQLMSWPSDSVLPPNPGDLLDLMDIVQHWQQTRLSEEIQNESADKAVKKQKELRGKTIIHCLNGGTATGLYCAASHTVDRMRVEQEVDAFLAARCITRSRPQFINTEDEYQFLYKIALQCMSRYTEYANYQ